MAPLVTHRGLVLPLDRANVDTDAILPKQFMQSVERSGYGPFLFDTWRYLDVGRLGMDCRKRPLNPDFVLNQPRYQGASILLSRRNFGCGSSREHAPWALSEYGFRVLIAPSFGDIFRDNCTKNGLLPISLGEQIIDRLLAQVERTPGCTFNVDLQSEQITTPWQALTFQIEPRARHMLLSGLDEIALTLTLAPQIETFEQRQQVLRPWLCRPTVG